VTTVFPISSVAENIFTSFLSWFFAGGFILAKNYMLFYICYFIVVSSSNESEWLDRFLRIDLNC